MKEPLLTAVVAYESETPVSNESLDRTSRHPTSPWARARVPNELCLSNFVPAGDFFDFRKDLCVCRASSSAGATENIRQCMTLLLDVDRDHFARPGHRVVEIVAQLQRELVLARCELTVEDVLP